MIPQELMNGNDEQFFQRNKNREGPIRAHHFQMKSLIYFGGLQDPHISFCGEIPARKESIDESLGEHFTLNTWHSQLICQDEIYDFNVFFFKSKKTNHAGEGANGIFETAKIWIFLAEDFFQEGFLFHLRFGVDFFVWSRTRLTWEPCCHGGRGRADMSRASDGPASVEV